ncbi:hypothetical protein LX92_00394 [Maribacter polysiphoniae]|uniref:Uncharacterized protein n=1 Tax=Maribacter polysiphoniae TaxID=429344 RepID=A0A316E5I6_9FLAO|nr:hypothetical protein LX92_00394 [Maribacter polysiphoniae]
MTFESATFSLRTKNGLKSICHSSWAIGYAHHVESLDIYIIPRLSLSCLLEIILR